MDLLQNTKINFIGNRNKTFIFSGILILISLIALIGRKGPNLSIDFSGGTMLQVKFDKGISEDAYNSIKPMIQELKMGTPEVKPFGSRVGGIQELQIIVKSIEKGTGVSDKIKTAMTKGLPNESFKIMKEEVVGPKVGKELGANAIYAIILSMIVIVVYIGIRFRFPYGVAAIVALFHDVIITLGVFAILDWEVSLPIIAAILTIVGYSLNDTIVVFDRIRENAKGTKGKDSYEDTVNSSINQTLSRTIITSLTTFVVVLTIFFAFFNTEDILKYFSGALIIGIISGTYSSIFIASPVLIIWNRKRPIEKLEE